MTTPRGHMATEAGADVRPQTPHVSPAELVGSLVRTVAREVVEMSEPDPAAACSYL